MYPKVDVIVTIFNQEDTVLRCLEGIKNQDYPNLGVFVQDNNSEDRSAEIASQFCQIQHWEFVKHKQNLGLPRALNWALKHLDGTFFIDHSGDDISFPNRITKQVESYLNAKDKVAGVFSDAELVNISGQKQGTWYSSGPGEKFANELKNFSSRALAWNQGALCTPTILYKRDIINTVGGFDEKLAIEDFPIFLKLSKIGRFEILSDSLIQKTVKSKIGGSWYQKGKSEPMASVIRALQKEASFVENSADAVVAKQNFLNAQLNLCFKLGLRNEANFLKELGAKPSSRTILYKLMGLLP